MSRLWECGMEPTCIIKISSLSFINLSPYAQSCISGKMYTLASDFLLANDILEIDPKETSLTSQDFLEYFYYAGLW